MGYDLIRSKRKTLSVCIRDGKVIVKAPLKLSVDHIDRFVASKSDWINRKLAEYKGKSALFAPLIDGTSVMYRGAFCPIVRTEKFKRITMASGALYVPNKYADKSATDRAIVAWYKRTAAAELKSLLDQTSVKTGLKYASFALTNARTKWGSCDGSCNIRLNWRLVMLDDGLKDYVAVHELCHTLYHDHSKEFWSEVKKRCPSCAAVKKRLNTYSPLTSMFR